MEDDNEITKARIWVSTLTLDELIILQEMERAALPLSGDHWKECYEKYPFFGIQEDCTFHNSWEEAEGK